MWKRFFWKASARQLLIERPVRSLEPAALECSPLEIIFFI